MKASYSRASGTVITPMRGPQVDYVQVCGGEHNRHARHLVNGEDAIPLPHARPLGNGSTQGGSRGTTA